MLRFFGPLRGSWSFQKRRVPSQRPDHWILTNRGRNLAMIMVADLIPGLKRFVRRLDVSVAAQDMVMRMVVTFLLHAGRMSCLQAAGAIRTQPRHRAQVGRLLKRPSFRCRTA